jgi:hypothetical protein
MTSRTVVPRRSTTASLPLYQLRPLNWSACARIAALAAACEITNTSPAATVPARNSVRPIEVDPLKYMATL